MFVKQKYFFSFSVTISEVLNSQLHKHLNTMVKLCHLILLSLSPSNLEILFKSNRKILSSVYIAHCLCWREV